MFRVNYLTQVFDHTNNGKLKESREEDLGRPFRDEPLPRSVDLHRSEEERIKHGTQSACICVAADQVVRSEMCVAHTVLR